MDKLLLTTYLASAIERNKSLIEDKQKESHKEIIKRELYHPQFGIYDPVQREGQKSGADCQELNKYISNLKKSGHWAEFDREMNKIWWGILHQKQINCR